MSNAGGLESGLLQVGDITGVASTEVPDVGGGTSSSNAQNWQPWVKESSYGRMMFSKGGLLHPLGPSGYTSAFPKGVSNKAYGHCPDENDGAGPIAPCGPPKDQDLVPMGSQSPLPGTSGSDRLMP